MIRRFKSPYGKSDWVELRPTIDHYEYRDSISLNWVKGGWLTLDIGAAKCLAAGYTEVAMKIDPNDLIKASIPGQCCGKGYGGPGTPQWNGNSWHDSDCPEILKPSNQEYYGLDEKPEAISAVQATVKRCTCGSASLGSDRHSSWCDSK